ncbi:MAG: FHA domain-containing RING-CH finger protein [archaeon]|nr:FHA domain-containing RING-CH finger protein [archaeon]
MDSEKEKEEKQLITKTWSRDSHGLFDYESERFNTKCFKVNTSGFLIREDGNVKFLQREDTRENTLAKLTFNPNKTNNPMSIVSNKMKFNMQVNNDNLIDLQEQIWYVVKPTDPSLFTNTNRLCSNYEYELKENDILKLGRIKFVVKKINIVGHETKTSKETFASYESSDINKSKSEEGSSEENICHVCYCSEVSDDNPMLSICKCKGSMHTHLKCLKLWLNTRKTVQEIEGKMGVSYTINKFNCEICNEPYPVTVKSKDHFFNLIDYEEPEGQNYIILQSLNSIKENSYPLSVHVLMFLENEGYFILGRGHESDVRISDISVSRQHAKIFMKDNKFYMEDLKSKFGTLALAKEEVEIEEGNLYQIGRTILYYGNENKHNNEHMNFQQIQNEFGGFGYIPGIGGGYENHDEDNDQNEDKDEEKKESDNAPFFYNGDP